MRLALYLAKRLGLLLVSLLGVSIITFVVTRVVPGNPAALIVGEYADHARVEEVIASLGFDRPLHEQYFTYLGSLLQGDLGTSWRTGNDVVADLAVRWPATVELAGFALVLILLWALPLGIWAGTRPGSVPDRFANALSGLGVSMPEFWLGVLLLFVFFGTLGWAPPPLGRISGVSAPPTITGFYLVDALMAGQWAALWAALRQLLLPAATLAFVLGAPLLRVTRAFMREAMSAQHIRAARALGVGRASLVFRHGLPNALLPVTTMMAMLFGYLLGGTVMVEYVFAWPGLGKYAVDSINAGDYAPVMAVVLVSALSYLLVYMLVDIMHFFLDPRSRA
ncbi:ABC transporter permease [Egibacter rhizosphaerae]|uniref:ABC transporter permease n=1 Tax=Egibacter rhizosphaerae TaxID=1670831 RepID=A0A411YHN8_9ACTN|nr:ABC transporter permease [Egibacter rhizosphaerae]QBI20845.1 ABC transporter permease [Egibacter rhizosphaerae]